MLFNFRCWLIKLLAYKMTVVLNAKFKNGILQLHANNSTLYAFNEYDGGINVNTRNQ